MDVYFNKIELETFNYKELKKMLLIQIKSEKFEGAAIIRDILNKRKININNNFNNENEEGELL